MKYNLNELVADKKLITEAGKSAKAKQLEIRDGNGVFEFDLLCQSLLTNHRRTYDKLMELGGEKLLKSLNKGGNTCLVTDPKAEKQGVRPIKGTDKFFLLTNAGEAKVIASIVHGIAGWAKMDKGFNAQLVEMLTAEEEDEFVPLFEDDFVPMLSRDEDFRLPTLRNADCTVGTCLKEPDENGIGTYIVEKDGWWAVADVDAEFIPRIEKMHTPFAFTSIRKPADFIGNHLLVERFGKKGVYNWEDKTYPVACEYDKITRDTKLIVVFDASLRGETFKIMFNGQFLPKPEKTKNAAEQNESEKKAEVKAEAPAPAPAPVPQPEPKKAEKKTDPNVPTLSTFGKNNTFRINGGHAPRTLINGEIEITLVFCGKEQDNTDPRDYIFGNYNIYKFERVQRTGIGGRIYNEEKEVDIGLTNLAAYALAKDGIFYAKDNKIYFKNIYGETKLLAEQRDIRCITDDGKGTLTVEYVKNYHPGVAEYRTSCGDWYDGTYLKYYVDIEKREVHY